MKFKNILCLTKVTKNQTQTERNENTIIFNDSKIEIVGNSLNVNIHNREILYVASSNSIKNRDEFGKVYFDVDISWVECFKNGEYSFDLPEKSTDILIITKEIYANMRLMGLGDNDIYRVFKEKGAGQISSELNLIEDFSVLTALIVE